MKTLYRLLLVFAFFAIQMPSFSLSSSDITGDTANNITFYSAMLKGIVNPSGMPTSVSFELGTDLTYGYTIIATPDSIEGSDPVAFEAVLTGIAAGITYHFRVKTSNSLGMTYGDDKTFTTLAAPTNNFSFKPERTTNQVGLYADISGSGAVIPVDNYDNCFSQPVDMGFDFSFAGANFNQFILNSNGFIKLGNVHPADSVQFFSVPRGFAGDMGGIFSSSFFADVFLISPFNHDLQSGTNPAEFRVFTEGASGSRICTIQFKNLQEKTEPPDHQFDNIEFQIRLHENGVIEFVYGSWTPSSLASTWRAAAIGLKGTGNTDSQLLSITKGSGATWQSITVNPGNYCPTCYAFNFGHLPRPLPEIGRSYVFYPKLPFDVAVKEIYTMGKLPVPYGLPHVPKAYIRNNGLDTLINLPVHLEITGNNLFSANDTIPILKPDSSFVVEFPGFQPTTQGFNTVTVTLPTDPYLFDNSKSFTQEITTNKYSYCDTNAYGYCIGMVYVPGPGSPSGRWLSKFHINGKKNITQARIGLGTGDGQTVYAVLLNSYGTQIAQSPNLTLTPANTWKPYTFKFPNPPVLENSDFYIGLMQTQSNQTYLPMGTEVEDPQRRGAFYTSGFSGSVNESIGGTSRFVIEAAIEPGYCYPFFSASWNCPPGGISGITSFHTSEGITNINDTVTICTGNPGNFTFYPNQVITAEQGTSFNFSASGNDNYDYDIFADWNADGDFYDSTELVYSSYRSSPKCCMTGTIGIPLSASVGNTRLRFMERPYSQSADPCGSFGYGETRDYSLVIQPTTSMAIQQATTFQCDTTNIASRGMTDVPVIGIKLKTTGVLDPLKIAAFNLSSAGCSNFGNDVSMAHLYYTGNSPVFSTNQLFGSGTSLSDSIIGLATLKNGWNYFWLAYDVSDNATFGNFLDAGCLDFLVEGNGAIVPAVTFPEGKLTINYCIPKFANTNGCEYGYGISSFSTTGGTTNITNLNNGCPTNTVSYSAFTNQSATAEQGSVFRFNFESTGGDNDFWIYIDWNKDFDFEEPNESVYFNDAGNYSLSGTITVPSDAAIGSTRFRIISAYHYYEGPKKSSLSGAGCQYFEYYGETEDYSINVVPGSPMTYQSGTTFQCDTIQLVNLGNFNVPVIGMKISVSGGMNPYTLTSFNLTSVGTTDFSHDVTLAQVYFTGNDSVFSLTQHGQLFGSSTDLGIPVTGNINLYPGNNYFWLTYNVADSATTNNYLDATCLGYTLAGLGDIAPEVISPPGRQIINYCIPQFDYPGGCDYGYGISSFSTSGGITNISNLNNGCPDNADDYSLFRDQVVSVKQGEAFQFNFESSGDITDFWMYIDWNQDFDFEEPNEAVYYNNAGNFSLSGIITVPSDAVIGSSRFRIISALHEEPWFKTSSPTGAGCQYVNNGGETEDYTIKIIPAPPTKTLNLTAFLEGLYPESGGSAMSKARNASDEQYPGTTADIITVELRDAVSPFMLSGGPYTANLNTDGTALVTIPASLGASYYIVVKHRNSIQTWSANPVSFSGSTINYNFSTAANAAYGNNLKQKGPLFLIYSGDVNQDGIVNALDQSELETAAVGFVMGYLTTDVNGDGIVDAFDLILTDNNAAGFVMVRKP